MNLSFQFIPIYKKSFLLFISSKFFLLFLVLTIGCSSTKRFSSEDSFDSKDFKVIKVLLIETNSNLELDVRENIKLSDQTNLIAIIKSGNRLNISNNFNELFLKITNQEYRSDVFFISPVDEFGILNINGKKYRGKLKIQIYDDQIKLVNQINLEDYVKGVMIKEMPLGKGNENYESLKAFSICARTYAYNKLKENKDFFDIYPDTRDQVYGGLDGETETTNKIVDETKGQILSFNDDTAVMFYHSTCGGHTENVKNVFGKLSINYLMGIKDGNEHYCTISPRYKWTEIYSEKIFIERLFNSNLIDNKIYNISDININSRFESGRVKELEIILVNNNGDEKAVSLIGNGMRSIIKNSDGKSILKSTMFDIELDNEKNIIINGKGSGHGVGMCQWGAIAQSKIGINYKVILNHYFPGTKIKNIYD